MLIAHILLWIRKETQGEKVFIDYYNVIICLDMVLPYAEFKKKNGI